MRNSSSFSSGSGGSSDPINILPVTAYGRDQSYYHSFNQKNTKKNDIDSENGDFGFSLVFGYDRDGYDHDGELYDKFSDKSSPAENGNKNKY